MAAKTKKPAKTQSAVSAERVRMALLARANAIAGLTPEILASHLEEFDRGYLRQAARVWQKIRDRDDQVKTVAGKREMAASLLDWEILTADDSPEAAAQKEALDYFYENLTATDALDENKRGGVSALVAQMLDAVGKKYAVHEIVWQPSPAGLTAQLRFVPLWFFNNTTARLRYMTSEADITGVELEDGGWIVTVGPCLMEATSIAYLFKRLPLSSWLNVCEKFGIPGLHGKTDARKGSDEWNAMHEALANFGQDWAILTNIAASITPIEVKNTGGLPHPDLVDRMDRAIARLWRGGDLSTMSKEGSAIGSQPQDKEAHKIEAADAMLVSETLHHYVDTYVLRYCFGENVEAKAYFKLKPTVDFDAKLELEIDAALIKWGVPRGIRDLLERYGRPEIAADDTPAAPPPPPPPLMNNEECRMKNGQTTDALPLANSDHSTFSILHSTLAAKRREALAPILHRLLEIDRIADPAAQRAALEQFHADLPALQRAVLASAPGMAATLEKVIATALVDGASGTGSLPVGSGGTGFQPVGLPNMAPRRGDTDWDESKYSRDRDGKFAPKGGGASGASQSKMRGKERARVVAAIHEARRRQGEVRNVTTIDGLGNISIGLGASGDKDADFKGGWGAAHWQGKHAESSEHAVADLLTRGKVEPHTDRTTGKNDPSKRDLRHNGWLGVLGKQSKGNWRLVTAFDESK